jgi:23S rRNA (uracil1939-C5)-methyltransferase
MGARELVVTPEGWLSRGDAFVRGDGRQLAIFGAIPGEPARIRLQHDGGHQVRARFIGPAREKHPLRTLPPCERWATCGRCSLMHLTHEGQRAMRLSLWTQAFAGWSGTVEEHGNAGAADVLHTLTLLAGRSEHNRPRLGLRANVGGLVAVPDCPVTTPELRLFMTAAAHHMLEQDLRPADDRGGLFRGIVVRQALATDEQIATLVFTRAAPFARGYADALVQARTRLVGVGVHWNEGDSLLDPQMLVTPTLGRPWFHDVVDGLTLKVGALDPWYATAAARDADVAAVGLLDPHEGDAVLDVGCGVGVRTLLLARRSGWALGVDLLPARIERARENAAATRIPAEFSHGDALDTTLPVALGDVAPRLAGRRPLVVLHTGTLGLDPAVGAAVLALAPRRVLLLGGNPRALANDARALAEAGYRLARVVTHDVDPHTPFSQGAALLVSRDASTPELRAPRRKLVRS